LLKNSKFFEKDSYNIINFFANFIQKYEFSTILVYFKGGIKNEDEIFLRD